LADAKFLGDEERSVPLRDLVTAPGFRPQSTGLQ
jgi:hypothetical protein